MALTAPNRPPSRGGPLLLAALVVALLAPLAVAPRAGAVEIPSYRILEAMRARAESGELERLQEPVRTLAPLLDELDRKYRMDLGPRFREGIAARDEAKVAGAILLLGLLESRELATDIRRDELTGWRTARLHAARAFLTYSAVRPLAKQRQADHDAEIEGAFANLAEILKGADLTTDPGRIERVRKSLLSRLGRMVDEVGSTYVHRAGD